MLFLTDFRASAWPVVVLAMGLAGCRTDAFAPVVPADVGRAGDGMLAVALESIREQALLPALGAALVRSGQLIEASAVGLRAEGSPDAVTDQDQWHLGSLTKAMTATVAAVLVERGDIAWSTTVAEVFPDLLDDIDPDYADIRLDDLLYHVAGLPDDISRAPIWPTLRSDPAPLTDQRRRFAAELLALPPQAPRGIYLYSNAGYIVAGSMLEEVTGSPWEELMQSHLFGPLGMTSSGFGAPGSADVIDQPRGHVPEEGEWVPLVPGPNADNPAALGPAGTVYSTFADYAAYMAEHVAGARGEGGIVSAATFAKLHTPAASSPYALGWGVAERDWANGRVLQHAGSNTVWYAVVWLAPERDFAMLAVTNAGGDNAARATDAAILTLIGRFEAAFGTE